MIDHIISYEVVTQEGGDPYGKPEVSLSTSEGDHIESVILPHEFPQEPDPGASWGEVADAEGDHDDAMRDLLGDASHAIETCLGSIIRTLGDGVDPYVVIDAVREAMTNID